MTDAVRQKVAAKVNLSETAFVEPVSWNLQQFNVTSGSGSSSSNSTLHSHERCSQAEGGGRVNLLTQPSLSQ
jgi:hypothetical protein